jgi:LytR cell envelope-related transcriptional attenuator
VTWKTPITLLVLLVLLLGGAFYGWKTIISPATEDKTSSSNNKPTPDKCERVEQFHRGQLIRADDVVVNVYNAGDVANLAEETLQDLKARGFKSGVFDNAPSRVSATNVTIITQGKLSPQVHLVAKQFKGKVQYAKGASINTGIDIVVGNDFAGIDHKAKKVLKLKKDVSTCAAVGSAAS